MKDKYKKSDELDVLLREWKVDLDEDPFMATRVQARIEGDQKNGITQSLLQIKCCLGAMVMLVVAMAGYLVFDYTSEKSVASDGFDAFAETLNLSKDQWAQVAPLHEQFLADIAFLRSGSVRIDESMRAVEQLRKETNYVDFLNYYQLLEEQRLISLKKQRLLQSLSDALKEVLDPDQYQIFNRFITEYTPPESYSS